MTAPGWKNRHDPMAEVERRLGVRPVEEINAERDRLVKLIAPLWARYGMNGTWKEAERKSKLATISALRRAAYVANKLPKPAEAALEEEAHAAAEYVEFTLQAMNDREQLIVLEKQIDNLECEFRRAQSIIGYLQAEARL